MRKRGNTSLLFRKVDLPEYNETGGGTEGKCLSEGGTPDRRWKKRRRERVCLEEKNASRGGRLSRPTGVKKKKKVIGRGRKNLEKGGECSLGKVESSSKTLI